MTRVTWTGRNLASIRRVYDTLDDCVSNGPQPGWHVLNRSEASPPPASRSRAPSVRTPHTHPSPRWRDSRWPRPPREGQTRSCAPRGQSAEGRQSAPRAHRRPVPSQVFPARQRSPCAADLEFFNMLENVKTGWQIAQSVEGTESSRPWAGPEAGRRRGRLFAEPCWSIPRLHWRRLPYSMLATGHLP